MQKRLAEAQAVVDAGDTLAEEVRPGEYKKYYIQEGNKKAFLLTMACGLKNGDPLMADCSVDPYKPLGKTNKPLKPDLQKEVTRRGLAKRLLDPSYREPRPKGWGIPQLLKWKLA